MRLSRSLGGALVFALVSHVAGAAPVDHDKASPAATRPGIHVAQATSPAPAPVPGAITGAAAMNALIGNTLVLSSESGKPEDQLAFYFLADGTVKGSEGNKPKTGKWTLTGNKLCVVDSTREPRPGDCVDLAVVGDDVSLTITFSGGKTDVIRGKILKGNPRNL